MRLLLFNLATDADDPVLGFTTHWIHELARQTEYIDVLTMRSGRIAVPANVCVYSVGKEKGYNEPLRVIEFYRILWSLLKHRQYDGCFAHMIPVFAVMAAPLLKFKRVPIVLWYTHKSVTWILRIATCLVDKIVTASPESFRIPSSKVRVIGHGIDTNKFVPNEYAELQQRPFTILTVGRLSLSKRVDRLLEAVKLFRQKHLDIAIGVNIVGGPATEEDLKYVAQLQDQVMQSSLSEIVKFLGNIPFQQVVPWYQQADCFVSLSDTGSLDKTVLEAMSCGIPVIAPPTYAGILGKELASNVISAPEPNAVCERICFFACMSPAERKTFGRRLRNIVIREHALATIGSRILREFQ
ncbi:MAG: glycosyltransferase family 4 protein [Candidatus Vecturithrix sp.]|jgi:glycosyltransferase involved in cell wall biosynthesis|nr:glycosyltransferase family 4 protein [Candidatus Vecturithrix sp.]